MIERRELFKIITVGALASPVAAQNHKHAAPPAATQRSAFFSADQQAVLDRLADIIIPTDEQSPGAHEAGVVRYLDLLAAASAPPRQDEWRRGIEAVESAAREKFSRSFSACTRAGQEQIVALMAAGEGAPRNELERFFVLLKPAVIDGYRYSEIGVRQYMGWVGNQFQTKHWSGACTHPEHGAEV